MLTGEETEDLLNRAKQGNDEAKEELINLNAPLIKSIVKRYLNKGTDYEDLFQLGAMGFVKAINNYDQSYNVKFTTYAVPMIAGEIKRFLRDDGSIKVSRSIKHNALKIKKYLQENQKESEKDATVEDISKALGIEREDVILALEANAKPISLNEKYSCEDDICLLDKVTDKFSVETFVDKLAIREMIKQLTSKEKQVIIMRYYLDKTQSDIAKELGVSQVQVSRIENKVILEMRQSFIK